MSKWRYSDPKPIGFTILDVKFFDNNYGIAVGGNGGIARTLNGGAKWEYGTFTFTSPTGLITNGAFSDISVPSANTAYTVGSGGMMAKTTDAGLTWTFVNTPLYANSRNINTCWFFNKDTGYIAGQWNTADSLPKLYRTRNGGLTWDSLAAPLPNGTTKVGFVNNITFPSIDLPITAKGKEIMRMQFSSPNVGYISGTGSPLFPNIGTPNITSTTTCALTGTQTTGSHNASLFWKFENGTLIDYSISKERLGYTGFPAAPLNCTSKFGTVTSTVQQYRAFSIINDSLVLLMSFNNNIVIRVRTGRNDSTLNVNRPGVFERGRYEITNTGNSGPPPGYPAIPPVAQQVLFASNPYRLRVASNGKIYGAAGQGRLWTSVDTGRTWREERSLPPGRNYSGFATWAFDFLPSGRLITMGQGGVIADSIPGGSFQSNYVFVGSNGNKIDFVDCNNGMVTGGGGIAVTTNGGNSWINKDRPDFIASFYSINGFHYTRLNKAYFAVSNGVVYSSSDQGTTLDPIYSNFNYGMNDVVGFGNDTTYVLGYNTFSIAAAARKTTLFRSVNNAASWQAVDIVPASGTTTAAANASNMAFPSRNVGYVCGTRNSIYKTINGGTTWTNISPFPALNAGPTGFPNTFVSYTDIFALDDNTVFVVGNMFTSTGIKRVYRTSDGGATWVDITGNMPALLPVGNMLTILFHDVNNGYVAGSNVIFTTNNGGTSWSMEVAPHGNINNTIGFSPRNAPTASFSNRKVFVAGFSFGNGIPTIMEYGDTLNVNVNTTENLVTSCNNTPNGSITINASGGLPPYSYSINGTTFQTSNVFTGLTSGVRTVTIRDNACGVLTKTINVGIRPAPIVNAGLAQTIIIGDFVTLQGSSSSSPSNITWTPSSALTGANTFTAMGNPPSTTVYTLSVTDANGCSGSANSTVSVLPYCVKPMGAFTPNGDGINDRWLTTNQGGACVTKVSVIVYNRYGHNVYVNQDYQNNWDGMYKGEKLPDATYYYYVTYTLINGNVVRLSGDVTIIR